MIHSLFEIEEKKDNVKVKIIFMYQEPKMNNMDTSEDTELSHPCIVYKTHPKPIWLVFLILPICVREYIYFRVQTTRIYLFSYQIFHPEIQMNIKSYVNWKWISFFKFFVCYMIMVLANTCRKMNNSNIVISCNLYLNFHRTKQIKLNFMCWFLYFHVVVIWSRQCI